MKINEVEECLNITRANVRFYEREGLITPKRENNRYRNYSKEDIEILQKIIIFRKIGLSIDTIREILYGNTALCDVLEENRAQLQRQIDELSGAVKICQIMEREQADATDFDTKHYWTLIQKEENLGHPFFDCVKDYADYEKDVLDSVLENSFLYHFEDSRGKYGFKIAFVILLLVCIIRGLCMQFLWKTGSFLHGFLYPFEIFVIISVISFPIYFLKKKYGCEQSEDPAENRKKSSLSLSARIICFVLILVTIAVLEVGVPVAAEQLIYRSLLQAGYACMNNGLYILYAITAIGAVGLIYWIFTEQIMGKMTCILPKKIKIKATVYVIIVYLVALMAYLGWYDCFTEDGVTIRRIFSEKEYTWKQAKSFDITAQKDGTMAFIVTMNDGAKLKPMDDSVSGGDSEAFVKYLVKRLSNDKVRCEVEDWKQVRKSLDRYEYWQEYMDELQKIIEDTKY